MQNQQKQTFSTTLYEKTHKLGFLHLSPISGKFSLKLFTNILIFTLLTKVLLAGALFLFPQNGVYAHVDIFAQDLIVLTNSEREKAQLPVLVKNDKLMHAAEQKAQDLMDKTYFAHTTPEGKPFFMWIQEADYRYLSAGENLAISFAHNEDIISAWMKSPTHRENILDTDYREIGIATKTGMFNQEETTVVVQFLGEPLATGVVVNSTEQNGSISGITTTMNQEPPLFIYSLLSRLNTVVTISLILIMASIATFMIHTVVVHKKSALAIASPTSH